VAVDRPLNLRSVNGPQFTTIDGGRSIRCVYLANLASLSGFTLTNGFAQRGGGLWCESTTAVVSNCVVSGNAVRSNSGSFGVNAGGGAYGGTLNNCMLTGNSARPLNAALGGFVHGNSAGGGAYGCTLNNCTLSDNYARAYGDSSVFGPYARGGGAYGCTLNNCTLSDNWTRADNLYNNDTYSEGGGAYGCTLNNCTLSGNWVYGNGRFM